MGEVSQEEVLENINRIKNRITEACKKHGRNSQDVKLLLATKMVSPELIKFAIENGNTLIGENRVQEYTKKHNVLSNLTYQKHFIGHLQTNKVNEALRVVTCIQSVDRNSLAKRLNQRLTEQERKLDIMVQVNTSEEDTKSGILPSNAIDFVKRITAYKALNIIGFMTVGLNAETVEESRPSYKLLSDISKEVIKQGILDNNKLELSMGMSRDLEIAIQEGSTMVRVGSSIFGERKY